MAEGGAFDLEAADTHDVLTLHAAEGSKDFRLRSSRGSRACRCALPDTELGVGGRDGEGRNKTTLNLIGAHQSHHSTFHIFAQSSARGRLHPLDLPPAPTSANDVKQRPHRVCHRVRCARTATGGGDHPSRPHAALVWRPLRRLAGERAAARAAAARAGLHPPAGAPPLPSRVSAFVKKQREDLSSSSSSSFNEIDHSDDDALDFNEFIKIVPEPLRAQASPRTLKELFEMADSNGMEGSHATSSSSSLSNSQPTSPALHGPLWRSPFVSLIPPTMGS